MKKEMRAYAKAHNMVVLAFLLDHDKTPFGVAVRETICHDGKKLFSFGRLFHIWGVDFAFEQCGCFSTKDEMEVRKCAYDFFGLH